MNNIEELRKIAQEEMEKQIKENINSSLIFKYVSDLEKENKILIKTNSENAKSVLDVGKPYKDLLKKIRDKIEELQENKKIVLEEIEYAKKIKDKNLLKYYREILYRVDGQIFVLQELLEEEK